MTKLTREELETKISDAVRSMADKDPQFILDAMARNPEALQRTLASMGFTVTERKDVTPDAVLDAHRVAVKDGAIQTGIGRAVRNRCSYRTVENPFTGRKQRNYLYSQDLMDLAGAWFRAFQSKNDIDPATGKTANQIRETMERGVRAPDVPFLGSDGDNMGVLVPTVIVAQIFEIANEAFVLRDLVTSFTSAQPLKIPRRATQITLNRGANATDISESDMALNDVTILAKRVGVLAYVDPMLAAAAAVGPVAYIISQIAEAFAKDDQRCIVNGQGDDEPLGWLSLGAAASPTANQAYAASYDNTNADSARRSVKSARYKIPQRHRGAESWVWVGNNDALGCFSEHNTDNYKPWNEDNETYAGKRFIETLAIESEGGVSTALGAEMKMYAFVESPLGLRFEQSNVAGKAWASDTLAIKAVQYVDGVPILPNASLQISGVEELD